MSEWINKTLSEVGTLKRGRSKHRPRYAFHLYNGSYPFIQTGEIKASQKYINKFENTYSDAGLKQSKLWPKGTLCITIAANIAELAILNFDACFPDSILGFIPDSSQTNTDYVYYLLLNYQKKLKHLGEGSVQDNINLGTFENIYFSFPSQIEQKAISSVLSSLDDKIDLLHRQNKTLESMAETLFRQWFIEEAEDDWEEMPLKNLFKIGSGKSLKQSEHKNCGLIPVFGANGQIGFTDKILFNEKLIFTGRVGTLGNVYIIDNQSVWLSDNTLVFKNIKNFYFTYFHLKKINYQKYNVGSTQPLIRQSDIKEIFIRYPLDEKVVFIFEQQAELIFLKITNNKNKIKTLEKLRDTLLPKLISGEVRVKYDTDAVA